MSTMPLDFSTSMLTVHTLATGKTRTHRMMRRAEMVRRMRENNRLASESEVQLQNIPFWRWRARARIEDTILRLRERAAIYAETLGEKAP